MLAALALAPDVDEDRPGPGRLGRAVRLDAAQGGARGVQQLADRRSSSRPGANRSGYIRRITSTTMRMRARMLMWMGPIFMGPPYPSAVLFPR